MPRLYTNEYFLNKLKEKGKNDLIPLDKYVNANTPIRFQCTNEDCKHIWFAKPVNVLNNKGLCLKCYRKKLSDSHKISQEEFEDRLHKIRPTLSVVGVFNGVHEPVDLMCDNGHLWHVSAAQVAINPGKNNRGCPYCNGLLLDSEKNSLFAVRPDLIKYFPSPDDTKYIFPRSMKKVDLKCPDCGRSKSMTVDNLFTNGFSCKYCKTDGVSYPNKFLRGLLKQLDCEWDIEVSYDWSRKYSYDGFIECNNKKYLIEMHGLQHYEKVCDFDFDKQVQRDEEKRSLALNNGFIEVEIDCKISNFNYIRQNILSSKLSEVIDFSIINWNAVMEEISENYVKTASNLFNDGMTVMQISRKLNMSRHTIRKYLLDASAMEWCSYY